METGEIRETRETGVVVIGGGVSGLAAAWSASNSGTDTVLLERSERFGGSVVTHKLGDYRIEGGPHSLLVNEPELEEFLRDSGLWERSVESSDAAQKRFVVRDGAPEALPDSLFRFISGSFLSVPGKMRMLLEPFLHGTAPAGEEAIGPWVERHFGREVREGLADPFISGIYAGDPDKISMQAAFPKLAEIAALHPSLLRSFLKKKKLIKESGVERYARKMISFPEGLGEIVGHLVRKGKFDSLAGVRLQSIDRDSAQWRVRYRMGSDPKLHTLRAPSLLVAVPPQILPELTFPAGIKESLAVFSEVESPPVTTFSIAFKRKDVSHPLDGFGMLAPSREKREVLGILFDSSLFAGRAPEDEVLLSAFLGGARFPEKARLDTETALRIVCKECRELLGVKGDPTFWKSTFWPRAIPQYNRGYPQIVSMLDDIEKKNPSLAFAGNARDGVALGSCILSGVRRMKGLLSQEGISR